VIDVVRFWLSHRQELATLVGQHVLLVAASTAIAVAMGVPLGVFAARRPRLASPLVAIANVVQTVPSLAMFGFLLPVPLVGGIGARAALAVLVLYALLPIVRSTIIGINGIDRSVREAGVAMGMTRRELLRQVELPLALPSIIAGIRVAAVVGVGSATIAAAIGAGGLGQYIYRGLSMVDTTVILAGAIPAACLALVVDGGLLWLEGLLSPRPARRLASRRGDGRRSARGAGARRECGGDRPLLRRHRRGLEEFHRAVDPRRDRRAGDRARNRPACSATAELGRHADLRSSAQVRRHRRLRRIHRHRADDGLSSTAVERSRGGDDHGAAPVRG
jgi:osmoprotectant transport system permease protein